MNKFNLEYQYQRYLKRVGLSEDTMGPNQKPETRRAFMGAAAQLLVLFSKDILELENTEAASHIEAMYEELLEYWNKEDLATGKPTATTINFKDN